MADAQSELMQQMMAAMTSGGMPTDVLSLRKMLDGFAPLLNVDLPEVGAVHEGVLLREVGGARVTADVLVPDRAGPHPVLVYLHGGGWVAGSPKTHQKLALRFAEAGYLVVNVDYRLAPEAPFPAAVDDAVAAYRWLLEQGFAPGRAVIAGDSAGGGLTAATLLAIRERGLARPAAGVLLSPWVDLEGSGESMNGGVADDPMVRKELVAAMAPPYLAGKSARTPLASPLYADLRGLPPLLIQVGRREVLLDDSLRFAQKAQREGVEVTLEVWPGMIHVWQIFASELEEGREAIARIGAFVKKHVG